MQRLCGDPHIEAALLGAAGGGVGDVGGQMEIGETVGTLVIAVLFLVFGKIDVGGEAAVGVELARVGRAFFSVVLLLFEVPFALGFADDADVAVEHRFAEEIVGADLDGCVLAGEVERLVGLGCDGKRGKIVPADAYLRVGLGRGVTSGIDGVVAEAKARGHLPVGGGDAEVGGCGFSTEDERFVGVADVDGDFGIGLRTGAVVEGEQAQMHSLARLVERLVGGERKGLLVGDVDLLADCGVEIGEPAFDVDADGVERWRAGCCELQRGETVAVGDEVLVFDDRVLFLVVDGRGYGGVERNAGLRCLRKRMCGADADGVEAAGADLFWRCLVEYEERRGYVVERQCAGDLGCCGAVTV